MEQLAEHQILEGLRKDDERIVARIYKKYGSDVLGYVVKNGGTKEEGLEILQLTVIKVWEKVKAEKYEDRGRFRQWFFQIAVNFWRMKKRAEQKEAVVYCGEWEDNIADNGEDELLIRTWKNNYIDIVGKAITKLSLKCQRYINGFYLEDKTQKQMVEEEGTNINAFSTALYKCRKKLKGIIEELKEGSNELKENVL